MPYSRLFRSRWAALFWAAGICWTAVSTVGGSDSQSVDAANASDNDSAVVSALLAEDPN